MFFPHRRIHPFPTDPQYALRHLVLEVDLAHEKIQHAKTTETSRHRVASRALLSAHALTLVIVIVLVQCRCRGVFLFVSRTSSPLSPLRPVSSVTVLFIVPCRRSSAPSPADAPALTTDVSTVLGS